MRRLAALGCVVALFGAACGDDTASPASTTTSSTTTVASTATESPTTSAAASSTTVAPTTTPAVVDEDGRPRCATAPTEQRTFVDETRSTPATAQSDELPSRTIDVWIDAPALSTPSPLVIFAHGLTGHPRSHEMHRQYLAQQCFVVVAPAFPLTNNDVENAFANAGDTSGQVGDVSFLIDEVLADPVLGPLVDPERIGMIGHSLGGLTTAGAALSVDGDPRISAAVVMSASFGPPRDDIAVMVVHGDSDQLIDYSFGENAYAALSGDRMFVTLLGGDHTAGIIDDDSDLGTVLRGLTGAFFSQELDNDPGTVAEVAELPLDLVSVEAGTAAGPLDDWRDFFAR